MNVRYEGNWSCNYEKQSQMWNMPQFWDLYLWENNDLWNTSIYITNGSYELTTRLYSRNCSFVSHIVTTSVKNFNNKKKSQM